MNDFSDSAITQALLEDIVDMDGKLLPGDHTSLACIPVGSKGKAKLICKADGVLAGVELAEQIFKEIDEEIEFLPLLADGSKIKPGDIAFTVWGNVIEILRAERVVLNFMQRMSGIATLTAAFVARTKGTKAKILDTRKTTPGLRYFEKWAVRIGGGHNLRFGLYDMFMIKDNHIDYCGGIANAIDAVNRYQREKNLNLKIEIEARSLADVDRIMFDNFNIEQLQEAVKLVNGKYETEASGGVTLDTVQQIAQTGVDYISVGALTHSARSLDLSLKAF